MYDYVYNGEKIMAKNMMKRILCGALALTAVGACAVTSTACETAHPEVKIVLEFNGEPYTLEYELYRKVSPSTVNHFLWLVGNGYYDGLCVHNYDYSASKMYTGAYSVSSDEESGIVYKPYYETIKGFENFADFPVSVWMDNEKNNPTYTLYGEFSSNSFRVENGAKKQSFGSLSMYYDAKDTDEKVYTPYLGGDKEGSVAARAYKYNAATSQFYISLSTSETTSASYCTFATLSEDSVEVLEQFIEDLDEFIANEYGDEDTEASKAEFVTERTVEIDGDDAFVYEQKATKTFRVPNSPIVIKSATVVKY